MNNNHELIAINIAKEHILPHGAMFNFYPVNDMLEVYMAKVSFGEKTYEETINTLGMPNNIAAEYIHCRIHGLAAKMLQKMFPINPLDL